MSKAAPRIIKMRGGIVSVLLRNSLRFESARARNFVVSGFPKSGTTWVSQLVAGLGPFVFEQNKPRLKATGVLLHTHSTSFRGESNILYVVRDPREAICSAARAARNQHGKDVLRSDGTITTQFVRLVLNSYPGARHSLSEHLQRCIDNGWKFVRFEDLKVAPTEVMLDVSRHYGFGRSEDEIKGIVEQYEFGRLKSRSSNNGFLGASAVRSWPELLADADRRMIHEHCGPQARAFGYDLGPW
jgi:hypothetical protein